MESLRSSTLFRTNLQNICNWASFYCDIDHFSCFYNQNPLDTNLTLIRFDTYIRLIAHFYLKFKAKLVLIWVLKVQLSYRWFSRPLLRSYGLSVTISFHTISTAFPLPMNIWDHHRAKFQKKIQKVSRGMTFGSEKMKLDMCVKMERNLDYRIMLISNGICQYYGKYTPFRTVTERFSEKIQSTETYTNWCNAALWICF